jgi:putative RNA 2'-phosphotransferase
VWAFAVRAISNKNVRQCHSIQNPPKVLFHGTSADNVAEIMTEGLLRMRRRFVHLSSELDWALRFVANKEQWVVFRILAKTAREEGVVFRQANRHVWLADQIDPRFLQIELSGVCPY